MKNKSSVRKLINAIESFWDAYADNLSAIAKGEEIKFPIEDKTVDTVLKMTKEMTSFEQFERISNPELKATLINQPQKPVDNMFEHAITQVKKNGKATN